MIESYASLPIGKYLDICAISESDGEELMRQARVLAILCDKTEDAILDLPIADYTDAVRRASFLTQPAPKPGRIADRYKAEKFSLVPTRDIRKLTAAQFIDYQTYMQDAEKNVVEIASVVLVPEGHGYGKGYDVAEVQEAIRQDLSVTDILSLAAFFLESWVKLYNDSRTYLKRVLKSRKMRRMVTGLRIDGDGFIM